MIQSDSHAPARIPQLSAPILQSGALCPDSMEYSVAAKRVVVLTLAPPQRNIFERFYVDKLASAGVVFDIWHLKGLFPEIPPKRTDIDCRRLESMADLDAALDSDPAKLFFLLFNIDHRSAHVIRKLHRHGKKLVYFSMGVFPFAGPIPRVRSFSGLVRGLLNRAQLVRQRVFSGDEFHIVCYAGEKARLRARARDKYVPMNLPDWEIANGLLCSNVGPSYREPQSYFLFLDCYLPFHPDLSLLEVEKRIDADSYAKRMMKIFDLVEKKYGCPVVIAAHPKAQYSEGFFGGRKIIQERTASLVQGCRAVLTHHSLSHSYAVIFRKPLCFIGLREFDDLAYGYHLALPMMRGMSEALNMPLIDVDQSRNVLCWPDVEEERYRQYTKDYITSRDDGLSNCEILRSLIFELG